MLQVSELEVSLLLLAEITGSGQAEALFMLYVVQSLMFTRAMHINSLWQQWVDSLENEKCDM